MKPWRLLGAALAAAVLSIGFWFLTAEASTLPPWSVAVLPAAAMGALVATALRRWSALLAGLLVIGAAAETVTGEWMHLRKEWERRLSRAPAAILPENRRSERRDVGTREEASYRLAWTHFNAHLRDDAIFVAVNFGLSITSALQAARLVQAGLAETSGERRAQ